MSKTSQLRQKAQNYIKKGKLDNAIEEYRKLVQVETRNPNLYNELGDLYLKAGDRIQAVLSFEKASVNYEKVALYNNAIAVCKKVLRVVPDRLDTLFKLGELKAKQKFEGEAAGYFMQYLQRVQSDSAGIGEGVEKKIELMLAFMHDRDDMVGEVAEVYRQLGFKVKAAELLNGLISRLEEKGEVQRAELYRGRIDEMKSSFSTEELKTFDKQASKADGAGGAAGRTFEPVVGESGGAPGKESEPAVAGAGGESERGSVSPGKKPEDEFGRELASAIDEAFEDAPAGGGEDVAAAAMGDDSGGSPGISGWTADTSEERTADLRPGVQAAGSVRQEVAVEDRPAAVEEEIDAAPEETVPETADETYPGPAAAESDGDEEARDFAREITSNVEEDDFRSHYDLGMAYIEMALYDEAVKELQIASRSDQLYLKSVEMMSHCFLKQDNPRLAVKQLQRVLDRVKEAGPENLGIYYNLGQAHEMLDEGDKARECFEEVYIIDITFRDIAEKMKKFGESP